MALSIDTLDLAKVDPCPGCGDPVRRLSVPIRGNGLDGEPSGPWYCPTCIRAKVDAAVAALERSR